MAGEVGNLVVKFGLDSTGFQNGVANINRQIRGVQTQFAAAAAQIGGFGGSLEGLKLKADSLSQQMELQKQKVAALDEAYKKSLNTKGADAKATQDLAIKLNLAIKALGDMETENKKVNEQIQQQEEEVKKQSRLWEQLGEAANGAKEHYRSLWDSMKEGLGFAAGFQAFDMIKEGIKEVTTAGIEFNSNVQQNTIAFTQMLGSAQKAKDMMSELEKFAADTPFELPDVEKGAKQLLAFGFSANQVIPYLTSIGDAASGLGLGAEGIDRIVLALGQMKAHGTADGNDLLQLMQAGIPVWDILSQKIGKSTKDVQDMVSKGLLPSGQAIDMLISGMEGKFPKMMDAQSKSFAGLMSTLHDSFEQTMGTVMKPAFDWMADKALPVVTNLFGAFSSGFTKGGLSEGFKQMDVAAVQATGSTSTLAKVIRGFQEAIAFIKGDWEGFDEMMSDQGWSDGVIDSFHSIRSAIVESLQAGGAIIKDVFNFMKDHGDLVVAVLTGIGAALAGLKIVETVGLALKSLNMLKASFMALGGIGAANPLGAILTILGLLVTVGVYVYEHWDQISAGIKKIWSEMKEVAVTVFTAIGNFFVSIWDGIKNTAINVFNSILDFFKKWGPWILAALGGPIGIAVKLIHDHFDQIKAFASQIWTSIVQGIQNIWTTFSNWISNAAKALWTEFVGNFEWLYNHNYYFKQLVDFIVNAFNELKAKATQIWNDIKTFFADLWEGIKSVAEAYWNGEKAAFENIWNTIVGVAKTVWGALSAFFTELWDGIKSVAEAFWNREVAGWEAIWNAVVGAAKAIFTPIVNFFSGIWTSIKTTAENLWGSISGAISTGAETAYRAVTDEFDRLSGYFTGLWNEAVQWGENLVKMVGDGIKNGIVHIEDGVSGAAKKIMDFLGFHSPTKAGPASDSDQWAPNFIKMFAGGLASGADQVGNAAKSLAQPLADSMKNVSDIGKLTNDQLSTNISILESNFDVLTGAIGNNANSIDGLDAKLQNLKQQYADQNEIVYRLHEQYLQLLYTKGAYAKETADAAQAYANESKTLNDLRSQIDSTTQSIQDQVAALDQINTKVQDLVKTYTDDLAAAKKNYDDQVAAANQKLVDDEAKLTQQYQQQLDSRAQSLKNFTNLFDAVQNNQAVSGQTLLDNLKGQVQSFEAWQQNMQALSKRTGMNSGLIDELKQMGPQAGAQIAALNTLTDDQLKQYVALWQQKNADAKNEAASELSGLAANTQAQIAQLQSQTAAQLDQYKQQWEQKNADIRANTEKQLEQMVKDAQKQGSAFVDQLATSMTAALPELTGAVSGVTNALSAAIPNGKSQPGTTQNSGQDGANGAEAVKQLKDTGAQIVAEHQNVQTKVVAIWQSGQKLLSDLWAKVVTDTKENMTATSDSIKTAWQEILAYLKTIDLTGTGNDIMTGLLNGIEAMAPRVIEAARSIANSIRSTIESALEIHSPSRVMVGIGGYVGQGLAIGMDSTLANLQAAANRMAKAAVPNVGVPSQVNGGFGASGTQQPIVQHHHHQYIFEKESVVIPAKDLQEMQFVSKFFGEIQQVARQRGE